MIKIGCANYPINAKSYQLRFGIVELTSLLEKTPRVNTVDKWRKESPSSFEFIVCDGMSLSEKTPQIRPIKSKRELMKRKPRLINGIEALRASVGMMTQLKSKILYLQIPRLWMPHPDRVSEIRKIVSHFPTDIVVVWEPPKKWPVPIIEKISETFNMIPAINPLDKKLTQSYPIQYFKLGDKNKTRGNYTYSDNELKVLKSFCRGPMSYVIFNNGPTSFKDALRFSRIAN